MHYSRRSPACLATLCILPSPTQKKVLCALEIQAAILIGLIRVVSKISSCRVNTTSSREIKRLGISFGSIFLLFSNKSSRGPLS